MPGQEQDKGSDWPRFVENGLASREINMAARTAIHAAQELPHVEIPYGSDEIGIMSDGGLPLGIERIDESSLGSDESEGDSPAS